MAIANPQQLNPADRLTVRLNIVPRCTGAVVNFALYIIGEAGNTANHANRLDWAKKAIDNPTGEGDAVSYYVLNQPSFLNGGSSIEDAELTGIVETAIVNQFITPAP